MGHWRSTSELHLMNSRSGIGDGAIGWLYGRLDGKHQSNLLHRSSFSRKGWEERGCRRGHGAIFHQALVNMTRRSNAGWKMIYWLNGTWYRARPAFDSDIHHRGEVRGELMVNYLVSGEQWEGQSWERGRGEHTTKSTSPLRFVLPLERANLVSLTQVVQKRKLRAGWHLGCVGGKSAKNRLQQHYSTVCLLLSLPERGTSLFSPSPLLSIFSSQSLPGNRCLRVCVCVCP